MCGNSSKEGGHYGKIPEGLEDAKMGKKFSGVEKRLLKWVGPYRDVWQRITVEGKEGRVSSA